MNKIDFKLLLTNTFQNVKFVGRVDDPYQFLIKYIIPYNSPQKAYLGAARQNWKIIREYCRFSVKKIHHIFHIDAKLTPEGWNYDPDDFKEHILRILYHPEIETYIPPIQTFVLKYNSVSHIFDPQSKEYQALISLYNHTSKNIRDIRARASLSEHLDTLLTKQLIFPYPVFKNLEFYDKMTIIVHDITEEIGVKLIKIFSFFNYAKIYEIEGAYFISSFEQEKKFEHGLMIKIYFPPCLIFLFLQTIEIVFEDLGITHYLILDHLFKADELLKSLYGDLDFLEEYNPLTNLIWSERNREWNNHKLFGKSIKERIYPDLFYGKDRYS